MINDESKMIKNKIEAHLKCLFCLSFIIYYSSFSPVGAQSLTFVELNCENMFDYLTMRVSKMRNIFQRLHVTGPRNAIGGS